jgi:hypothetical protein
MPPISPEEAFWSHLHHLTGVDTLQFLNSHELVRKLTTSGSSPVSDFSVWERRNAPFRIPPSLKALYRATNGVSVSWHVNLPARGTTSPLGHVSIPPLDSLQRPPSLAPELLQEDDDEATADGLPPPSAALPAGPQPRTPLSLRFAAERTNVLGLFAVETIPRYGHVVLVYNRAAAVEAELAGRDPRSADLDFADAEVWLQARDLRLSFVAANFSDYLRLMASHCAIRLWQAAFTPHGLDPRTARLLRRLAPSRLEMDAGGAGSRPLLALVSAEFTLSRARPAPTGDSAPTESPADEPGSSDESFAPNYSLR